jgi:nicotinamidase-related amidase
MFIKLGIKGLYMKQEKALLIIDMLNDFVREGAPLEVPSTRLIIPNLKKEIEKAKDEQTPIIYICDTHQEQDREFLKMGWPVHAVKGTNGSRVINDLKPDNDDIFIEKPTFSAFYKTNLNEMLKKMKINTLRITGTVTHICILFTAAEGGIRGYDVEVPEDCVAGLDDEDSKFAFKLMRDVFGVKII